MSETIKVKTSIPICLDKFKRLQQETGWSYEDLLRAIIRIGLKHFEKEKYSSQGKEEHEAP